jgi:3-deoxy-D-manno-octulosonate 8-phosphate phosphatase (KDO 8-P phosphatase)
MIEKLRTDLVEKLSRIKLLVINADGLITENQIPCYGQSLSLNNGHALGALKKLGVKIVALSMRKSETLSSIASRLRIELLYQGVSQKSYLYSKLRSEYSVSDSEIAFIGGDFSDLPIIEKVAFSVAPADAALEVKARSYYVAYSNGEGAVREVAELILKAKNHSSGLSE